MPDRYLIIEARFYEDIADHLVTGAIAALEKAGASYDRISVPGALEIPAAILLAHTEAPGRYQGYIALGCVIRGETSHYDYVCGESAHGLQRLALDHALAIGNGILTTEDRAQAIVRADPDQKDKGADAANAAIALNAARLHFRGLAT